MSLSIPAILSRCTRCNTVSYDAPNLDSLPDGWQYLAVHHFPDGSGNHSLCPACAKGLDEFLGVVDVPQTPPVAEKPKRAAKKVVEPIAVEPEPDPTADLVDEINQLRNTLKNQGRNEEVSDACIDAPPKPVMEWGALGVAKLTEIRDRLLAVDGLPF